MSSLIYRICLISIIVNTVVQLLVYTIAQVVVILVGYCARVCGRVKSVQPKKPRTIYTQGYTVLVGQPPQPHYRYNHSWLKPLSNTLTSGVIISHICQLLMNHLTQQLLINTYWARMPFLKAGQYPPGSQFKVNTSNLQDPRRAHVVGSLLWQLKQLRWPGISGSIGIVLLISLPTMKHINIYTVHSHDWHGHMDATQLIQSIDDYNLAALQQLPPDHLWC